MSIVCLLGQDADVNRTLRPQLKKLGIDVTACGTLGEFATLCKVTDVGCVVSETRLPGSTAQELLKELADGDEPVPVVFFSSVVGVSQAVRAMKAGAFDFLENRGDVSRLIDTVSDALEHGRRWRAMDAPRRCARDRASRLTHREGEVFQLVVEGLANKQVGGRLGIADKTVETHRSRVMSKMEATTLAELVRMADVLGMFRDEVCTGSSRSGGVLTQDPG